MYNSFSFIAIYFLLMINCTLTIKVAEVKFNKNRKQIGILNDLKMLSVGDSVEIIIEVSDSTGYLYIKNSKSNELIYGNSINPENITNNPSKDSLVYNYYGWNEVSASSKFEPYVLVFDRVQRELVFYTYDKAFEEYCRISWK